MGSTPPFVGRKIEKWVFTIQRSLCDYSNVCKDLGGAICKPASLAVCCFGLSKIHSSLPLDNIKMHFYLGINLAHTQLDSLGVVADWLKQSGVSKKP